MSFAYAGASALDYAPCNYGASRLMFRGPQQAVDGRYCAVLGGTETYGKFVPDPWPALVAEATGARMVNLACVNAGTDVYLNDPAALDIARGAALTVVQITGAANLTNRFYSVHPRRNDRFLVASPRLREICPGVDFTDVHFTCHLLQVLRDTAPDGFAIVVAELQETWLARMTDLIDRIGGPVLLLWMGDGAPPEEATELSGRDPLFVTAAMVETIRARAAGYVEVVASRTARAEGVEAMAFAPLERPAAESVPGPRAHREVAEAVTDAIVRVVR